MTTISRFTTALTLCALLAACGGGGGGGGTTGGGGVTPPTTPNVTQQSVQREDAQSGIAGVQAARSVTNGDTTTYAKVRALRAYVERLGKAAIFGPGARYGIGPCSGGQETSQTNNPNGTVTLEIDTFYDNACTAIESKLVWTASQSGADITGPATSTQYSNSGTVTETDTMTITFYLSGSNLTGFSLQVTSIVQNGAQVGQAGVACTIVSTSSISCGVADANNVTAGEVGANVSETVTVASNSNTTLSMQVSAYQANAANALSISAATFPFWTVSPAADQTQSVSVSGSTTATSITLTVTDSTNGGSLAIGGSTSGAVTGTLTRTDTGATVATFSIDGFGNGTLTYGGGTQVSIVNYAVQG